MRTLLVELGTLRAQAMYYMHVAESAVGVWGGRPPQAGGTTAVTMTPRIIFPSRRATVPSRPGMKYPALGNPSFRFLEVLAFGCMRLLVGFVSSL